MTAPVPARLHQPSRQPEGDGGRHRHWFGQWLAQDGRWVRSCTGTSCTEVQVMLDVNAQAPEATR